MRIHGEIPSDCTLNTNNARHQSQHPHKKAKRSYRSLFIRLQSSIEQWRRRGHPLKSDIPDQKMMLHILKMIILSDHLIEVFEGSEKSSRMPERGTFDSCLSIQLETWIGSGHFGVIFFGKYGIFFTFFSIRPSQSYSLKKDRDFSFVNVIKLLSKGFGFSNSFKMILASEVSQCGIYKDLLWIYWARFSKTSSPSEHIFCPKGNNPVNIRYIIIPSDQKSV